MPATEPIQGGPYPEPSDAPDGPNQMAALAVWAAGRLVMRFASTAARDAAITSPVEDMIAFTGTGATQVMWAYRSGAWHDVTVRSWVAYTPTWTNLTVGNGSVTARYCQIGEGTFSAEIEFSFGSTTSVTGIFYPSLPSGVTAIGGGLWAFDASTDTWALGTFVPSSYILLSATGAVVRAAPTAPWTWAAGDLLRISITGKKVA